MYIANKFMKQSSASSEKHKREVLTAWAGDGREQQELSCTADRGVEWPNHFGKQFGSSYKISMYPLYGPAIQLLDSLPKRKRNRCLSKDLYMKVHSSFICSIPKGKQLKCPSVDELTSKTTVRSMWWDTAARLSIRDEWYTYTCSNMNESWNNAERKRPDKRQYMPYPV